MSDAEIEATTVGEADRPDGQIQLVDYDPTWPVQFALLASHVRDALGHAALAIDHAGSTAVPGLAAKPIIDIVLVVRDASDEGAYAPALEAIGYALKVREPDWFELRMFKRQDPATNLHVFSLGCPEIERLRLFRDWLRTNTEDRELYERTKRGLAQDRWRYVQNYADAKSGVITEIMDRARARSASRQAPKDAQRA
jgi:GrpB-like predicted nucleotidyltransferase (UPF0157 family)